MAGEGINYELERKFPPHMFVGEFMHCSVLCFLSFLFFIIFLTNIAVSFSRSINFLFIFVKVFSAFLVFSFQLFSISFLRVFILILHDSIDCYVFLYFVSPSSHVLSCLLFSPSLSTPPFFFSIPSCRSTALEHCIASVLIIFVFGDGGDCDDGKGEVLVESGVLEDDGNG